MSNVYMTMPGKIGDAIHQFPVVYWYHRETSKPVNLWLDKHTLAPLVPLFETQACVESVELIDGISGWQCGGQPFHFELPTSAYEGRNVYHLGLRAFPQRQLTLECLATCGVPISADAATVAESRPFTVTPERPCRRLVLHGQGVCPHNRQTPGFWKFLHRVADELPALFDEIVFVGNADDREVARRVYPDWDEYADNGNFLRLAELLAGSAAFMGCGSAPAALAQWMQIPTIRVHDKIGESSKRVWDGLGKSSLNATEFELRREWAEWRDRWLDRVPA